MTTTPQPLCLSPGDPQVLSFPAGRQYQYRYALAMRLDPLAVLSPGGGWLQAEALLGVRRLWRDPGGEELLRVQVRLLQGVMLLFLHPFPSPASPRDARQLSSRHRCSLLS